MPKKKMFVPIDLSNPGALDELMNVHRGIFGGWTMVDDAGGDGSDGTGGDAVGGGDGGGGTGGKDGNKPISEMTDAERLAYFERKANRLQNTLSGMKDYESTKAELAKLKQDAMTEQEQAVAAAKLAGREEASKEFAPRIAGERIRAKLSGTRTDEQIDELLEVVDLSKFVGDDGNVDTEKVNKYVAGLGSAKEPDMGQGRRKGGSNSKGAGGQAEAEKRFGKSS